MNHEETLTKLADSLTSIAKMLPRVDMHLNLYPSELLKENVEELYALLIKFYQRALRWYSAGPLKHLMKSFTRPYNLEFADIVAQVNVRARLVDDFAVAMAHRELRALHNLVHETYEAQKGLRCDFNKIWPALASIQSVQSITSKQIQNMQDAMTCMCSSQTCQFYMS
jgi:hypothetical protein